jgi:hypothetical protein
LPHAVRVVRVRTVDDELPAFIPNLEDPVNRKIGEIIASNLVEDGATIQVGVGDLPQCVLPFLRHHKNLGVHSEMISDGVMDLYERGVITNSLKVHKPGHIVSCAWPRARPRCEAGPTLARAVRNMPCGCSLCFRLPGAVRLVPRQPMREPVRHRVHEQQRTPRAAGGAGHASSRAGAS